MTQTITNINRKPGVNKKGEAYVKIGLQLSSRGDTWINGFEKPWISHWQTGTELTDEQIQIEEDPKWGWQFKVPKSISPSIVYEAATTALEQRIAELESWKAGVILAFPKMDV